MGVFLIPVLLVIALTPTPQPSARALQDFARLEKSTGHSIALVDLEGTVREGLLADATADGVTMRFAGGERVIAKADIASAERIRDSNKDGAIKGALFGAVVGIFAMQGYDSAESGVAGWFGSVAIYSGIGWVMDNSQQHRQPIYRSTAAPAPTVKVSLRF